MEQAKGWIDSLARQLISSQFIKPGTDPAGTELYGLLEFMKRNVLIRQETVEQNIQMFRDVDLAKRFFGELVTRTV